VNAQDPPLVRLPVGPHSFVQGCVWVWWHPSPRPGRAWDNCAQLSWP